MPKSKLLVSKPKPLAVVALGGNALIENEQESSLEKQEERAKTALSSLVHLHEKYNLVITHGNGPQVGNLVVRSELAKDKAYQVPLDYCVAQSQGEIGFLLSQAIEFAFEKQEKKVDVVAILTRAEVSKNDKAFLNPTKPIGYFFPIEKTAEWKAKGLPFVEDAGRGYRRVVPSPIPISIPESHSIANLAKQGSIVIAVGGGGIPIVGDKGVEAVIDKDMASALLANTIGAKLFVILTAVDAVYLNYKKPLQRKISQMNIKECKKYLDEGHFLSGSMKPKIEAALKFLEAGGEKVIITEFDQVKNALAGKSGTIITGR